MLLHAVLTKVHLARLQIPLVLACWASHPCVQEGCSLGKAAGGFAVFSETVIRAGFHPFLIILCHPCTKRCVHGAQRVLRAETEVTASVLVQSVECPPGPEYCQLCCLPQGRQSPTSPHLWGIKVMRKSDLFFYSLCHVSTLILSSFLSFH